jgi:hypothetical protein
LGDKDERESSGLSHNLEATELVAAAWQEEMRILDFDHKRQELMGWALSCVYSNPS